VEINLLYQVNPLSQLWVGQSGQNLCVKATGLVGVVRRTPGMDGSTAVAGTIKSPGHKPNLHCAPVKPGIGIRRVYFAELYRLKAVFLATLGADETEIEASFLAAIRIAREQKSISLEKRAGATYAEYRRQKASASGGRGFRLPL
jgi:hypothetical protein